MHVPSTSGRVRTKSAARSVKSADFSLDAVTISGGVVHGSAIGLPPVFGPTMAYAATSSAPTIRMIRVLFDGLWFSMTATSAEGGCGQLGSRNIRRTADAVLRALPSACLAHDGPLRGQLFGLWWTVLDHPGSDLRTSVEPELVEDVLHMGVDTPGRHSTVDRPAGVERVGYLLIGVPFRDELSHLALPFRQGEVPRRTGGHDSDRGRRRDPLDRESRRNAEREDGDADEHPGLGDLLGQERGPRAHGRQR